MSLPTWAARYLERLGLPAEPPSLPSLGRLTRAHLATNAFENISKMHYFQRAAANGWHVPPVEVHVANMHRYHFGGTCFTNNSGFQRLLTALGYEANLVRFASNHMGVTVRLPEGLFYVDVGSGLPFFEPVLLEGSTRSDSCGVGYHIYPKEGEPGAYHLDHYLHGNCSLQWEFYPHEPAAFADFADKIQAQNTPGSLFMTILRCQLWQPEQGRSLSLVSTSLAVRLADGTETRHHLPDLAAIEAVIAEEFRLPNLPVREAVGVLESLGVDIFKPKE